MSNLDRFFSRLALQAADQGLWTLEPGHALTLHPRRAGELCIARGAVWVTHEGPHAGTEGGPQGDLVLTPGTRLTVNIGDALVIEPIATPDVPLERVKFDWTEHQRVAQLWHAQVGRPAADLGRALADAVRAAGSLATGVLRFCLQWRQAAGMATTPCHSAGAAR